MNLLIGNGINRLSNSLNWTNVLQNLVSSIKLKKDKIDFTDKPYLHIYEEIYTLSKLKEIDLKKSIVTQLSIIKSNEFHEKLLEVGFHNILTTNYDYGFTPVPNIKNTEKKYSLFRYQITNKNTKVWHIHGELNNPDSIMLGYDHYLRSITNIQNYFENIKRNELDNDRYQRKFDKDKFSWLHIFLHQDLYILGLELDFGELDLWWLLSHRNRSILSGEKITNKIVYITDNNKTNINKSKLSMMQTFGVNIKTFELVNDDYKKFYDEAIHYFKNISKEAK